MYIPGRSIKHFIVLLTYILYEADQISAKAWHYLDINIKLQECAIFVLPNNNTRQTGKALNTVIQVGMYLGAKLIVFCIEDNTKMYFKLSLLTSLCQIETVGNSYFLCSFNMIDINGSVQVLVWHPIRLSQKQHTV